MPKLADHARLLRWMEGAALGVAVLCLGWAGVVVAERAIYEHLERPQFEADRADAGYGAAGAVAGGLREVSAERMPASTIDSGALPPRGSVIGILEIPRIGFSQLVAEGDDDGTLRVAIGHLPDTPLPWHPGNSALAGHRDGHFRPLREIRSGDRILLATRHGDFSYVVEKTMIVNPEDVWVLDPTSRRALTLITCYPFNFIGRAPMRFVIRALTTGH
jgi:sortase A